MEKMNRNIEKTSRAAAIFARAKQALITNLLLNKRMLKNKAFLAVLIAIPLLVGAFSLCVGGEGNGIMTVAVAVEEGGDELSKKITDELRADTGLVDFVICGTPAEADREVEGGRADVAWIFPADLGDRIARFASHPTARNTFVTIIQREDNIFLKIAHEKLHAVLYPHLSRALYRDYLGDHVVPEGALDGETIDNYYDAVNAAGADLFKIVYLGKADSEVDTGEMNFLTSPLRGLLSVMVILCAVAVAMLYSRDEERGVFDRFHRKKRFSLTVSYHFAAIFDVCAIVFAALYFSGLMGNIFREAVSMLLYCAATVGFCILLRLLLGDIRVLGALSPLLIVGMAVLCPVFLSAPKVLPVQLLLPTYYYLNAVYRPIWILYMAIYCIGVYGASYALYRAKER